MADRLMFTGANWPPLKLEIKDETGVLNLTGATIVVTCHASGPTPHDITGAGTPIWPAQPSADGQNEWNLEYEFAPGDTDSAGTWSPIEAHVIWPSGKLTIYETDDTLTVKDP